MKTTRHGTSMVTEVVLEKEDIMEVMKKVLAKDKTLDPKEVAKLMEDVMSDALTPRRAMAESRKPDFSEDELEEAMEGERGEDNPEPTLEDDIAEGMGIIFGGVEEGPMRAELEWLTDPKHDRDDPKIQVRFEEKGVVVISQLDIDDMDHLLFFLDLLDKDTGPWYYYRSLMPFSKACERRLVVLAEEDKAEQQDQALMDEAMLKKRGKRDE